MPLSISTLSGEKKQGSSYKHNYRDRVSAFNYTAIELLLKMSLHGRKYCPLTKTKESTKMIGRG